MPRSSGVRPLRGFRSAGFSAAVRALPGTDPAQTAEATRSYGRMMASCVYDTTHTLAPMAARPNPLLRPGSESAWRSIAEDAAAERIERDESVAERLVRGQRLSAEAAALRRSIRDERRPRTGS